MGCPKPGGGHAATRLSRSFAWRDCIPARGIRVAGGKAMKKRRHKTAAPKRRNTRTAVRRRGSSAAADKKIAQLTRERDELLEQQAATSEVLKIVGSAAGDLNSVFQAMLEKATCGYAKSTAFASPQSTAHHASSRIVSEANYSVRARTLAS